MKVVVTSTILPESITISCLPTYIEFYENHNTINSTHEHVQPSLINKHRVSHKQIWNVIITAVIVLYFLDFNILLDLTWYFYNHVVLNKWNNFVYGIQSLVSQRGIYSLLVTQNLICHRLNNSHFIWHHTFQHYSDKFKLNNCGNCLNLTINNQPS